MCSSRRNLNRLTIFHPVRARSATKYIYIYIFNCYFVLLFLLFYNDILLQPQTSTCQCEALEILYQQQVEFLDDIRCNSNTAHPKRRSHFSSCILPLTTLTPRADPNFIQKYCSEPPHPGVKMKPISWATQFMF